MGKQSSAGGKSSTSHHNSMRRVGSAQHLQGRTIGKGTLFAPLHHNVTYSTFISIKMNLNQLLQFVNSKHYHKNETKTLLRSMKKLEKLQT